MEAGPYSKNCSCNYDGRSESKERFAIQRYLLIIGKKQNMQVLSHTFTYLSTYSPWTLRHLSYRHTSLLIPSSYQTAAWLFNQSLLHNAFHWDTFDHPPYSLDLAPSDFYLFSKMKEHLVGKRFTGDEDLQHAVLDWLNSQAAVWYEEGISKLVSRYNKCLNVQGDYVEK